MSFTFENDNVEFKSQYVPEIKKTVIAFANAQGGTLYIGVEKDGKVCGVENADEVMLQIANSLKDAIAPDIMPFVSIHTIIVDDLPVIEINISIGTNRPYYLKEKGLKPNGVYIRKGSSSQPVSDEGIRKMIIESSGRSYESERSLIQDLTFTDLANELKQRDIKFGDAQMRNLNLVGLDNLYTNLAYLLSDQCQLSIKLAHFDGRDKVNFIDRKIYTGPLLFQLRKTIEYLTLVNRQNAVFSQYTRIDRFDYPIEALREALLNSIVHRDYSDSNSNIINIYSDRIEFVSVGGLVPGLELKSIFLGASRSRNPNLAALFYRMRLIESYGTGIAKIQRAYQNFDKQPIFETAEGVFRVTLPNMNTNLDPIGNNADLTEASINSISDENMAINTILQYINDNGSINRKATEQLLNIGSTKAYRLLRSLCSQNIIKPENSGRLVRYVKTSQK